MESEVSDKIAGPGGIHILAPFLFHRVPGAGSIHSLPPPPVTLIAAAISIRQRDDVSAAGPVSSLFGTLVWFSMRPRTKVNDLGIVSSRLWVCV